jgi:hypothetical protein
MDRIKIADEVNRDRRRLDLVNPGSLWGAAKASKPS